MKAKRNSFIMLLEHIHTMDEFTDEEVGKIVRAYAAFVESDAEPDFDDRSMRIMWKNIKAFDEVNREKIASQAEARREAGKRGMAKRWGNNKTITDDNKNNKAIPSITSDNKDNLSVSVSVSDSVSVPVSEDIRAADASHSTAKSTRFHPPDLEEVKAYFAEKGGKDAQAERFYAYYESNGWKVGKNPMRKWKAAASGWISRDNERNASAPVKKPYDVHEVANKVLEQMDKEFEIL